MTAGRLKDRVEFQQRGTSVGALGGQSEVWTAQFERAAEFSHLSGDEGVEAARIAGREVYRVKLRASAATQGLTTDGWRIRDVRRDKVYNILSVDGLTDRAWVWLRVEA